MSSGIPVAEDLFVWPSDQPQLIGGKCGDCGSLSFPLNRGCPRCGSDAVERTVLPAEGTLWTWTSQDFLPKEPYLGASYPDDFEPWYVGLVNLGGEIRVEGRLSGVTRETLRIGDRFRTVVVPFVTNAEGEDILTFAFEPVVSLDEVERA